MTQLTLARTIYDPISIRSLVLVVHSRRELKHVRLWTN
uniref:Uncharacterized protein n=1 Tax=Arundo donax TaxID=35708 RepID=A0A0A8YRI7_ARUDO